MFKQLKKLDGKWGLVIKIYLIITLIVMPIFIYEVFLGVKHLIDKSIENKELLNRETFTIVEYNMLFHRALERTIISGIIMNHSAKGVNDVSLQIGWHAMDIFPFDNKTNTACVILTLDPNNDINKNIEIFDSVKRIIKFAIEEIMDENIYIISQDGLTLDDFMKMSNLDN